MNANEIDIIKLTPEDYLKMRDRCRELENETIRQQEHILELENALLHMSEAAKESEEKIEKLNACIGMASKTAQDYYNDREKFHKIKNAYQDRCNALLEENAGLKTKLQSVEAVVKDADAKIQSANDRAANAKKEAKAAKERAESASEQVRYLERKLRDTQSLNDALTKELARIQETLPHIVDNDADVYQKSVMRYAPSDFANGSQRGFMFGVIGLCGEAGEASELVKKNAFHGHTLDYKHLASELGDVLWYLSYTAYGLGYSLSEIMAINQQKLAKRYPNGKFDAERSRNREEGDI